MMNPPESAFSGEFQSIPDLTSNAVRQLLPEPWWPELVEASLPYQDCRDDAGHTAAVLMLAAALAGSSSEAVDRPLLFTAALLHDVGWSRLSPGRIEQLFSAETGSAEERALRLEHERVGAALARELLESCGSPSGLADEVCTLVDGHDTRGGSISAEDSILRDADRLWMVTDAGFAADLRRRSLDASAWAGTLRSRFSRPGGLFLPESRRAALHRLDVLEGAEPRQRVLIAHYRVGWTDGVSLEIEKRRVILEEMGFDVRFVSGPGSRGADYVIEELDFESEQAKRIARNAFGSLEDYSSPDQLLAEIENAAGIIERKLIEIFVDAEPDFVMTHNIFSHGRHIAAAAAFYKVLSDYGLPSLTTHHDFYWERDDFRSPSCAEVAGWLDRYVPPEIPLMKHAVINSLAAVELQNRRGIDAMIFPDTLDFAVPPWEKDRYNSSLLSDFDIGEEDIVILQATRIVRRKGIELVPPVISRLNSPEYIKKLRGRRLYNGRTVSENSKFVFILAGYAEHEAEAYREQLTTLMRRESIEFRFLHPYIAAERGSLGERKVYSLFDTYAWADLVSYPSIYEGWGNQFIEAVFARKPVLLHEYPVFKSDIKPIGYNVISMGSSARRGEDDLFRLDEEAIRSCCDSIVEHLLSPETDKLLEENFTLARRNNSYEYLRTLMKDSMEHFDS